MDMEQPTKPKSFQLNGFAAEEEEKKKGFGGKVWKESKIMWSIALPAIITSVAQFSIAFVTAAFVGRIGEVELAAVSIVQNVLEGFAFGVMLGMGSALETLCGQAVGAGEYKMLGIYLQRSWIITLVTAVVLSPLYIFTAPILKLLRQSHRIADVAGKFSLWVLPQLFAYALNFPVQKFLQAQSKIWVMTFISLFCLGIHVLLNWILVTMMRKGVFGAAMAANLTWFLMVVGEIVYVISGLFPESWTGFSFSAFKQLYNFVKLSLASAIMLCLELWYFTLVLLMVGWLRNPELAVAAISICMNIEVWVLMIGVGFNAAISVRVSNELGAKNPKAAKFSIGVTVVQSTLIGLVFMIAILVFRQSFPRMFSSQHEVIQQASSLGYLLAITLLFNNIQPVLHGVAVGAGWQRSVAIVNLVCYYFFGLPLGGLLGYKANLGVRGIWIGMLVGILVQTVTLILFVLRTNWNQEAWLAEERIREYSLGKSPSERQQEMEDGGVVAATDNNEERRHMNGF